MKNTKIFSVGYFFSVDPCRVKLKTVFSLLEKRKTSTKKHFSLLEKRKKSSTNTTERKSVDIKQFDQSRSKLWCIDNIAHHPSQFNNHVDSKPEAEDSSKLHMSGCCECCLLFRCSNEQGRERKACLQMFWSRIGAPQRAPRTLGNCSRIYERRIWSRYYQSINEEQFSHHRENLGERDGLQKGAGHMACRIRPNS